MRCAPKRGCASVPACQDCGRSAMDLWSWNHQQELGDTDCVSGEHHPCDAQECTLGTSVCRGGPSCGCVSRMEDRKGARRIVRSQASPVLRKLSGALTYFAAWVKCSHPDAPSNVGAHFNCLLWRIHSFACNSDYAPAESAEFSV